MTRLLRALAVVAVLPFGACSSSSSNTSAATPASSTGDAEYDRLCADVPMDQRAKCPVGSWAKSVEDVEGGVIMHLQASAPPPAETAKRMRCHRAWMAHDPANAMPRCPIGSPGIIIDAVAGAEGTDLKLLATKPEDVAEVRKRSHSAVDR